MSDRLSVTISASRVDDFRDALEWLGDLLNTMGVNESTDLRLIDSVGLATIELVIAPDPPAAAPPAVNTPDESPLPGTKPARPGRSRGGFQPHRRRD